jgi:hypothetical protein
MSVHGYIVTKIKMSVHKNLVTGSRNQKTRAREGGASVFTTLLFSFFIFVPPSVRRKVLGAKPKQAGKKEGGWGEGIFARLLPLPFRLRKGKAEGGFGGNSAFPLRNQIVDSPATCLNTWRAEHHRKILFSLKEKKIGRAQNEKSKEYFSVVWRACRAVAGLASLLGVLLKKCSNINQKTPPSFAKATEWHAHVYSQNKKKHVDSRSPHAFL